MWENIGRSWCGSLGRITIGWRWRRWSMLDWWVLAVLRIRFENKIAELQVESLQPPPTTTFDYSTVSRSDIYLKVIRGLWELSRKCYRMIQARNYSHQLQTMGELVPLSFSSLVYLKSLTYLLLSHPQYYSNLELFNRRFPHRVESWRFRLFSRFNPFGFGRWVG